MQEVGLYANSLAAADFVRLPSDIYNGTGVISCYGSLFHNLIMLFQ